jgi:Domain of unknown function (DUF5060)/Protein of unknown function (DUF4038)/Domain of unknown function (DUF5605)
MKTLRTCLARCLLVLGFLLPALSVRAGDVEQWGIYEVELKGPAEGNPFVDVQLAAVFENGAKQVRVDGFYDGDGVYRVRFMPDTPGKWTYRTESNRWPLTGKTGVFTAQPPAKGNRGPVRVHDTFHFAYADGTPFKHFGTTIYNWIDTPEALQEETLRTLAASPFNKARMLITQQPTPYRNEFAPPRWPYVGKPPHDWDFMRFNPEFFRHYEKRIGQLRDLGIEADLVLFNPYGKFGFETLDAAGDERFVRYVVARFGAYRNVWWSLANEYDFLRTKTEADWDRFGRIVQQCDPYGHLLSIHNGHQLFDHRQPWVTHLSVQDGEACESAGSAKIYRDAFRKPVVFDEIKYEGDAKFRWADLDGFGMTHRFWAAMMGGTYVGHGDYFNTAGEDTWPSFGGKILGQSVPRLAFLRRIVEEGPAAGLHPIDAWMDPGMAGAPGDYYLHYFGRQTPASWTFQLHRTALKEGMRFRVEVIDTWAMTITPVAGEFVLKQKDRYHFVDASGRTVPLPGKPGIALRIIRIDGTAPPVEKTATGEDV